MSLHRSGTQVVGMAGPDRGKQEREGGKKRGRRQKQTEKPLAESDQEEEIREPVKRERKTKGKTTRSDASLSEHADEPSRRRKTPTHKHKVKSKHEIRKTDSEDNESPEIDDHAPRGKSKGREKTRGQQKKRLKANSEDCESPESDGGVLHAKSKRRKKRRDQPPSSDSDENGARRRRHTGHHGRECNSSGDDYRRGKNKKTVKSTRRKHDPDTTGTKRSKSPPRTKEKSTRSKPVPTKTSRKPVRLVSHRSPTTGSDCDDSKHMHSPTTSPLVPPSPPTRPKKHRTHSPKPKPRKSEKTEEEKADKYRKADRKSETADRTPTYPQAEQREKERERKREKLVQRPIDRTEKERERKREKLVQRPIDRTKQRKGEKAEKRDREAKTPPERRAEKLDREAKTPPERSVEKRDREAKTPTERSVEKRDRAAKRPEQRVGETDRKPEKEKRRAKTADRQHERTKRTTKKADKELEKTEGTPKRAEGKEPERRERTRKKADKKLERADRELEKTEQRTEEGNAVPKKSDRKPESKPKSGRKVAKSDRTVEKVHVDRDVEKVDDAREEAGGKNARKDPRTEKERPAKGDVEHGEKKRTETKAKRRKPKNTVPEIGAEAGEKEKSMREWSKVPTSPLNRMAKMNSQSGGSQTPASKPALTGDTETGNGNRKATGMTVEQLTHITSEKSVQGEKLSSQVQNGEERIESSREIPRTRDLDSKPPVVKRLSIIDSKSHRQTNRDEQLSANTNILEVKMDADPIQDEENRPGGGKPGTCTELAAQDQTVASDTSDREAPTLFHRSVQDSLKRTRDGLSCSAGTVRQLSFPPETPAPGTLQRTNKKGQQVSFATAAASLIPSADAGDRSTNDSEHTNDTSPHVSFATGETPLIPATTSGIQCTPDLEHTSSDASPRDRDFKESKQLLVNSSHRGHVPDDTVVFENPQHLHPNDNSTASKGLAARPGTSQEPKADIIGTIDADHGLEGAVGVQGMDTRHQHPLLKQTVTTSEKVSNQTRRDAWKRSNDFTNPYEGTGLRGLLQQEERAASGGTPTEGLVRRTSSRRLRNSFVRVRDQWRQLAGTTPKIGRQNSKHGPGVAGHTTDTCSADCSPGKTDKHPQAMKATARRGGGSADETRSWRGSQVKEEGIRAASVEHYLATTELLPEADKQQRADTKIRKTFSARKAKKRRPSLVLENTGRVHTEGDPRQAPHADGSEFGGKVREITESFQWASENGDKSKPASPRTRTGVDQQFRPQRRTTVQQNARRGDDRPSNEAGTVQARRGGKASDMDGIAEQSRKATTSSWVTAVEGQNPGEAWKSAGMRRWVNLATEFGLGRKPPENYLGRHDPMPLTEEFESSRGRDRQEEVPGSGGDERSDKPAVEGHRKQWTPLRSLSLQYDSEEWLDTNAQDVHPDIVAKYRTVALRQRVEHFQQTGQRLSLTEVSLGEDAQAEQTHTNERSSDAGEEETVSPSIIDISGVNENSRHHGAVDNPDNTDIADPVPRGVDNSNSAGAESAAPNHENSEHDKPCKGQKKDIRVGDEDPAPEKAKEDALLKTAQDGEKKPTTEKEPTAMITPDERLPAKARRKLSTLRREDATVDGSDSATRKRRKRNERTKKKERPAFTESDSTTVSRGHVTGQHVTDTRTSTRHGKGKGRKQRSKPSQGASSSTATGRGTATNKRRTQKSQDTRDKQKSKQSITNSDATTVSRGHATTVSRGHATDRKAILKQNSEASSNTKAGRTLQTAKSIDVTLMDSVESQLPPDIQQFLASTRRDYANTATSRPPSAAEPRRRQEATTRKKRRRGTARGGADSLSRPHTLGIKTIRATSFSTAPSPYTPRMRRGSIHTRSKVGTLFLDRILREKQAQREEFQREEERMRQRVNNTRLQILAEDLDKMDGCATTAIIEKNFGNNAATALDSTDAEGRNKIISATDKNKEEGWMFQWYDRNPSMPVIECIPYHLGLVYERLVPGPNRIAVATDVSEVRIYGNPGEATMKLIPIGLLVKRILILVDLFPDIVAELRSCPRRVPLNSFPEYLATEQELVTIESAIPPIPNTEHYAEFIVASQHCLTRQSYSPMPEVYRPLPNNVPVRAGKRKGAPKKHAKSAKAEPAAADKPSSAGKTPEQLKREERAVVAKRAREAELRELQRFRCRPMDLEAMFQGLLESLRQYFCHVTKPSLVMAKHHHTVYHYYVSKENRRFFKDTAMQCVFVYKEFLIFNQLTDRMARFLTAAAQCRKKLEHFGMTLNLTAQDHPPLSAWHKKFFDFLLFTERLQVLNIVEIANSEIAEQVQDVLLENKKVEWITLSALIHNHSTDWLGFFASNDELYWPYTRLARCCNGLHHIGGVQGIALAYWPQFLHLVRLEDIPTRRPTCLLLYDVQRCSELMRNEAALSPSAAGRKRVDARDTERRRRKRDGAPASSPPQPLLKAFTTGRSHSQVIRKAKERRWQRRFQRASQRVREFDEDLSNIFQAKANKKLILHHLTQDFIE